MTQITPDFITIDELPSYTQDSDVVLLDVRDNASFNERHLPDAISISPQQLSETINELDNTKHYIVICYHGVMAVPIANFILAHNRHASVLKDGMAAVH